MNAIPFAPRFEDQGQLTRLKSLLARVLRDRALTWEEAVRVTNDAIAQCQTSDTIRLAICVCLLRDLSEHGWTVMSSRGGIRLYRPTVNRCERPLVQVEVRAALQAARARQLAEPSVSEFIERMVRERGSRKSSVFRLMRDGTSLAGRISQVRCKPVEERASELSSIVRPYLQFVDESAVDEWTGHRLMDVWRYFRHTWLTPYRSTPGRSMLILVRDAAVEPHAVIGIASLASPIVRQKNRDMCAEIDPETIAERLQVAGTTQDARWLERSLEDQISSIYTEDFLRLGILRKADMLHPTPTAIAALDCHASRINPNSAREVVRGHRWEQMDALTREAESPLFSKKRAVSLASLLQIRMLLADVFAEPDGHRLREALKERRTRDAVVRLLRAIKNERTGTSMMEINVCGAVPPYNELLGGKLVALLMLSPEVRAAYRLRYGDSQSVIASRMAGRPITKAADLVLLTTSGIFPGRSSQYNRVVLPGEVFGRPGVSIKFEACGPTEAYSTIQFSDQTVRLLQHAFEFEHSYRHVNSKFGEGVSPRLRKIRQQLDNMGLDSDALLKTGHSRTIYVAKLCTNSADFMLGRSDEPDYIAAGDGTPEDTEIVAEFWRKRWVAGRIEHRPAMTRLAQHNINFPALHGAAVKLPIETGLIADDWAKEDELQEEAYGD